MEITKLKTFAGSRALQHGQHVAIALCQDSGPVAAVYDDNTGHWLSLVGFGEIGYLDTVNNDRVLAVTKIIAPF